MAEWLSIFLLAFAVSLDSFGVGLTYGMRALRLSVLAYLCIVICSFLFVYLASIAGDVLQIYLPARVAESLGGWILIGIGAWAFYQGLLHAGDRKEDRPSNKPVKQRIESMERLLFHIEIRWLGLVIRIIRKPTSADVDGSGVISFKEALLLGVALSLDAFGAGLGASFMGISATALAFTVSIMCIVFLALGIRGGNWLAKFPFMQALTYVPGLLLIALGIIEVIG
ncbi:sporulation membrane protein YtaF [Salsuginibacillus kocurii]|uniref:sporulation membrane protein YtaF n=1 Tax=Salsuginibacillus kocurii TaxID=427078 RepID=UPI00037626D0|nr:sporulation membrane protein YtaF [Salsuginibacillus kocurii]